MAKQSTQGASHSLPNKKLMYLLNLIEHQFFEENLIVSNLTPYDEIYRDGPMSVRHYPPLQETEILVEQNTFPVAQEKHRVPVLLVPALAATAVCFDLFPNRSVVRYLLAQGFDVYLLDWGGGEFQAAAPIGGALYPHLVQRSDEQRPGNQRPAGHVPDRLLHGRAPVPDVCRRQWR